jgi:uncharacterized protein YpmS
MNTKNLKILAIIIGLAVTSLSCNLMSSLTPARVVPTLAPGDAQQLQSDLAQKLNEAMSGVPVTVVLTESQLTSLVNQQAANQQQAQLSNLQVILENNQMIITGNADTNGISGQMNITLDISTGPTGKPQLVISNAKIGGFPIPENMLTPLSTVINQAMDGQGGEGFEIISLSIADHTLTITGQKK